VTRLHLIANHAGDYKGISASYSGDGFSGMKFIATALEDEMSFEKWVNTIKLKPKIIKDFSDYRVLAAPSINVPVTYYSQVPKDLFSSIVTQYEGGMNHGGTTHFNGNHESGSEHEKMSHGDMKSMTEH